MGVNKQTDLSEALTERELEILKLLVTGHSNGEIAKSLFIALETVKWYNRRIFEKLQVSNRTEAAARAHELGLLEANDTTPVPFSTTIPQNLPTATSPFVGRENEIAKLAQLITQGNRLITILAPGGMGKSRLAIETARQFLTGQLFPNGIFFVPLAQIRSSEQFIPTIAEHIGIQFLGAEAQRQQLLDYFREKRLLLILDNFEHLLDKSEFIRDILEFAPTIHLLISSREKLNLQDEAIFALRGLEFVEEESEAFASDAIKLFIQAAKLARNDFKQEAEDLQHITRICRLVQGMPLGLILAAAWLDILSLREIADEIAKNLDFLESQARDIPDRQRSIRAVFDHAWWRLSQDEQSAFMKLAVFRGGFTRIAAQNITGASLRSLQKLASKALIVRVSEERFEIHELLRQYAELALEASGEGNACRHAHSLYYLKAVAEREADIKGKRQFEAISEVRIDFENVRAAWFHAVETKNIDLLNEALEVVAWFCLLSSNFHESISLFQTTIERLNPSAESRLEPLWGRLLLRVLRIDRWRTGTYLFRNDIEDLLQQCLVIAEGEEDELEIARCLVELADYFVYGYKLSRSLDYFNRAQPIYEKRGDIFHLAWLFHLRAQFAWGKPSEELHYHLLALDLRRRIGDMFGEAASLTNLCEIALLDGKFKEAESYLEQSNKSVPIFTQISLWNMVYAALIPLLRGDFGLAYQRAIETQAIAEKTNHTSIFFISLVFVGLEAVLREDYMKGLAICQRCLPMNLKPHVTNYAHLGLVLAACGQGKLGEAQNKLMMLLQHPDKYERLIQPFIAPIAAFFFYHYQHLETAAQMVGAAYQLYPEVRWHEQWKPFTRLKADLVKHLGDEAYESAFQSGEKLSAEQIFKDLQALITLKASE
jgi:predicted ATPase/DNA-binding CsgD family transcriptional regulator